MTYVRWRICSFLFGFGFLAYVQQKTITIAAEQLMPALHLSHEQLGWLETAFVWGYAMFQLPGGLIGQRLGARRAFIVIGLGAFLATIAMPIVPEFFSGHALFWALLCVQLLLGFAQAAIFPVSAGVFEAWFPQRRWSFVQGLQTMGLQLGAALTPALIVNLTLRLGWQRALLVASVPALGLIALWAWYGRDTPREHPAVSAEELAEIGPQAKTDSSVSFKQLLHMAADRNVILLFVSYMCMNYTFYLLSNWVFLYLIEERHFSALQSSVLSSAPPLAAALGAGLGGVLTAIVIVRLGYRWGYRLVPLLALPAGGALLLYAVSASNAYVALATLAACYGAIELTEGAYWGAAMTVGRGDAMAVCGIMNTGGNMGGIIALPIVGHFAERHAWNTAFLIGVAFAAVSALAWFGIRISGTAAHPASDLVASEAGAC